MNLPYTKRWSDGGLKNIDGTPRIWHLGRHLGFHRRAFRFSHLVVPPGFNMVGGLGLLHITGQVSLCAKRALGPLSSGSKDHDTHNTSAPPPPPPPPPPPISPAVTLVLFHLGKIPCFKSRVWEADKTGKLMRTSNVPPNI